MSEPSCAQGWNGDYAITDEVKVAVMTFLENLSWEVDEDDD